MKDLDPDPHQQIQDDYKFTTTLDFQTESRKPAAPAAAPLATETSRQEAKRRKRNKKDPHAGLLIPARPQPPPVSKAASKSQLKAFLAQSDEKIGAGGSSSSKLQNFLKLL